jgi:hypothetical protein
MDSDSRVLGCGLDAARANHRRGRQSANDHNDHADNHDHHDSHRPRDDHLFFFDHNNDCRHHHLPNHLDNHHDIDGSQIVDVVDDGRSRWRRRFDDAC